MSEQTAEHTARRSRRHTGDEGTHDAPGQPSGDGEQPNAEQPTGPDLPTLAALDENAGDLTDEQRAAFAALTDKQREELAELRSIAAIQGFSLAGSLADDESFAKETTPVRNRKPPQMAMDAVAAQAYSDWVAAERPTLWQKMPVITYFLDAEEAPEYRKLINRTPDVINAEGDATGVRIRYGKEFVLSEKMAQKIGKPEAAGKTVLAWAVIDKRKVQKAGTESDN